MIETRELTRRYRNVTAVDAVTFACRPGTVTGFLGPNGAGKSTTLRMLVGLTPPTSGSATVDGRPYRDLPRPGRTVGVMLGVTAQHPGRTGRETMRIAAATLGVPPRRSDEMLERVGLSGAAGRRVGTYSLGMRQRLGLAQALLGAPVALVLDEPANGLDPEGIRWMRGLLREFAAGGGTVLLSSHLLAEVQATVDHLVVIDHGRIVAQGPLDRLLTGRGVVARGVDPAALHVAITGAGLPSRALPDGTVLVDADVHSVGRAAAAAGQALLELRSANDGGLDDFFARITGGNAREAS